MHTKYDDCRRVDNRYTTAIGMSVWRFFNIGKYKNQKVKDVCYSNPFYVAWCLENWQGFSLTSYERSNYMKGLERQLEKDPEDQELILKVSKCKYFYRNDIVIHHNGYARRLMQSISYTKQYLPLILERCLIVR